MSLFQSQTIYTLSLSLSFCLCLSPFKDLAFTELSPFLSTILSYKSFVVWSIVVVVVILSSTSVSQNVYTLRHRLPLVIPYLSDISQTSLRQNTQQTNKHCIANLYDNHQH